MQLLQVPIECLEPDPENPRRDAVHAQIEKFAESLRTTGRIVQPLGVTCIGEANPGARYRILYGERRWRAARLAGFAEVPVCVLEAPARVGERRTLQLVENLAREEMNPLDVAQALADMRADRAQSLAELGAAVCRSNVWVSRMLSLLDLPEAIQHAVRSKTVVCAQAAHLLAQLEPAARDALLERATVDEPLTRRQVEASVEAQRRRARPRPRASIRVSLQPQHLRLLLRKLGLVEGELEDGVDLRELLMRRLEADLETSARA